MGHRHSLTSACVQFEGNEFQTNVISPLLSKSAQSDGIQYDGEKQQEEGRFAAVLTGNQVSLPLKTRAIEAFFPSRATSTSSTVWAMTC